MLIYIHNISKNTYKDIYTYEVNLIEYICKNIMHEWDVPGLSKCVVTGVSDGCYSSEPKMGGVV